MYTCFVLVHLNEDFYLSIYLFIYLLLFKISIKYLKEFHELFLIFHKKIYLIKIFILFKLCLVPKKKKIQENDFFYSWFYYEKYETKLNIIEIIKNIIKISKRNKYIFKLFNFYKEWLRKLNEFEIKYKNNVLNLE